MTSWVPEVGNVFCSELYKVWVLQNPPPHPHLRPTGYGWVILVFKCNLQIEISENVKLEKVKPPTFWFRGHCWRYCWRFSDRIFGDTQRQAEAAQQTNNKDIHLKLRKRNNNVFLSLSGFLIGLFSLNEIRRCALLNNLIWTSEQISDHYLDAKNIYSCFPRSKYF